MSAKDVAGGIWLAILIPIGIVMALCTGFFLLAQVVER